jgi:hypothetical protein
MEGERQKRWQFSLRDVLQAILIVALAVGWFVDRSHLRDELARQQQPKPAPVAVTVQPTLTPLPTPTLPPPTTGYPRFESYPSPRLTIPNIVPSEATGRK